jgi:hypothetical protein
MIEYDPLTISISRIGFNRDNANSRTIDMAKLTDAFNQSDLALSMRLKITQESRL